MIQIEHIRVEEFRGIREIDLDLRSKSFVVHGPNGSGKSGIVDAIDFALTGTVRRLSGEGTGTLSVVSHAPHVHSRSTPANAVVKLTVKDVDSGKSAVLTRSVAGPRAFDLTPDVPEVRAALGQVGAHPELTLSRRELINLVVSTAAKRSEGIQALLQLDRIGVFRSKLQQAQNKANQARTGAQANVGNSERSLLSHVGGNALDEAVLLATINEKRAVLGVPALSALAGNTDFLEGATPTAGRPTINLPTAIAETDALIILLGDLSRLDDARDGMTQVLAALDATPGVRDAIRRQQLLTAGLSAVVDSTCPLCGLDWPDMVTLQAHLQAEIDQAAAARTLLQAVGAAGTVYRSELAALKQAIDQVVSPARLYGAAGLAGKLESWSSDINQHSGVLQSEATIVAAADLFTVRKYDVPVGVAADLDALSVALKAVPDVSAAVAARDFLGVAKERWLNLVGTSKALATATSEAELAGKINEAYAASAAQVLEVLYQTVEQDFSRYYRYINTDDEASFSAQFTQSQGSLDLTVDFYGIGMFPPNAYHSEGHQDGMGVCLYLALMKQLLGDDFRLSILDDVVMSVDINHRKQFCELLKAEFPNVQFVITTHDEVWARQMQSAGLVSGKQQARFYGWSVDDGPLFEQGDVWERIDEDLRRGEVNGAAHKLRRRLEAATADIAEAIGGRVTYRGDASYQLGELLDAVNAQHKDLLSKAAASANLWNNDRAREQVSLLQEARSRTLSEHDRERWALNVLVHNNDWATMGESDFQPVLNAAKQYLDLFICNNNDCTGWIYVEGRPPEILRCDCGNYMLNLKAR